MRRASAKSAKQVEIANRRRQVSGLALARVTQTEIARQLGVSKFTVCMDLKKLRAEWALATVATVAENQAIDLAALAADEASIRARMTSPEVRKDLPLVLACYDRIAKIMERRGKILGVESAAKLQVDATVRGPLEVVFVDDWKPPLAPQEPPRGPGSTPAAAPSPG